MGGREAGQALVDVVMASVVLLMAVVATASLFQVDFASEAVVTARSQATRLAQNVLAAVVAYGCGLETGVDLPAGAQPNPAQPGAPYASTVEQRCAQADGSQATLGDPAPYTTTVQGVAYTVSVTTVWVRSGAAPGQCPSAGGGQPAGAQQTVSIAWSTGGVARGPVVVSNFAAVPGAAVYHDGQDGGVLVTGMAPGSMAVVSVPGFSSVQRFAAAGCAWFPFLPPGAGYQVSYCATGQPGSCAALATLTVPAGQVVTEQA